jgi:hypothetical protein
MKKLIKLSTRLVIANVSMAFAIIVASLLPGFWTGISGRDFRPQALNASILIFVVSLILRYKFKWSVTHMICSLIPLQFIVLICISYSTGYNISEIFSALDLLQWLLIANLFISLPWICGTFVGGFFLKRKKS